MKNKKGVSLIVLVITIIVMIILATAVVLTLSNSGIMAKANEVVDETDLATVQDLATMLWADKYLDSNGKATKDELRDAVITGLKASKVDTTKYSINVTESGVTVEKEKAEEKALDWAAILADATANPDAYRHPDQDSENKAIGIGTDGHPVNMDDWLFQYALSNGDYYDRNNVISPENGYMLNEGGYDVEGEEYIFSYTGYKGSDLENINIPQYIKAESDDSFLPVTALPYTFSGLDIEKAPEIPSTVKDLWRTFQDCKKLSAAPVIGDNVLYMGNTFSDCSALKTAPEIPESVTDMSGTFYNCSALKTAPEIPESVTDMSCTFLGCSALETAPVIPEGVTNMGSTFSGCSALKTAPEIPEGVTDMDYTFSYCSALKTAPEIPEGVTYMDYTFSGCSSLTGDLVINANPKYYCDFLYGAATNEGTDLKLSGSSTMLEELLETATGNVSLK